MTLAMDLLVIVAGICALIGIAHYGNKEADRALDAKRREQRRRDRNRRPARRAR